MNQTEALRRLRVGGIIAIATIAILAIAQALLIQWRYTSSPLWARIADRSSLRTADTIDIIYRAERAATAPSQVPLLRAAVRRLIVSQQAFHDLSTTNLQKFSAFTATAQALVRTPKSAALRRLLETRAQPLVAAFATLSAGYARGGDVQRGQFRRNAFIDCIALLAVLALLYGFVLRPSESSIRRMLAEVELGENALLRSRERFRSLFEQSPNAIVSVSGDGTINAVNLHFEHLTGYDAEDLIGRPYVTVIPAERRDIASGRLALLMTGRSVQYDGVILCKDGSRIDIEADSAPIRIGDSIEGVYIIMRDLVVHRALARRLEDKDERVRGLYLLASSATEVTMLVDDALSFGTRALDMTHGFVVHFDGDLMTVLHRHGADDVLPLGHRMNVTSAIGARMAASPRALAIDDLTIEPYAGELRERNLPWKSSIGTRIFVENAPYGALVFTDDRPQTKAFDAADLDLVDLIGGLVGTAVRREIAQKELQDFAFHDVLTGLANRRVLDDRAQQALAYAKRAGNRVAIHYIDLDDFKAINDVHGHAAGDEVLIEVARRFSNLVREQDLLARIGGDEFVAVQTAIESDRDITSLSHRLAESLEAPLVLSSGRSIAVHASFGTAIFPDAGDALETLLQAADVVMYREKERHRASRPNGNYR